MNIACRSKHILIETKFYYRATPYSGVIGDGMEVLSEDFVLRDGCKSFPVTVNWRDPNIALWTRNGDAAVSSPRQTSQQLIISCTFSLRAFEDKISGGR